MNKPPQSDIDSIVQMVVDRLRGRTSVGNPVAASSPTQAATDANDSPPGMQYIPNRLVTLADLEGRLDGTHTVQVGLKSLLTPAVHDEFRRRKIKLVRSDIPSHASEQESAVLSADFCIVSDLKKFSVASALVKQLKPSIIDAGLASSDIVQTLLSGGLQVPGRRTIWCARQPYLAQLACAQNAAQLRAVGLFQAADLRKAIVEASPTVLIVDDQRWTGFQVGQLLRAWSQVQQSTRGALR